MTRFCRWIQPLVLIAVTGVAGCAPYYGRLPSPQQRELDQAMAAKAAGDVSGGCATLASATRHGHPAQLIQHARCLMDPKSGAQNFTEARLVLERAYAMHSRLRGRAALLLGTVEQQSGGPPAAQVTWLERARELGEPGTDKLLLHAWKQDPPSYRRELIAAYERNATTDPFAALELARLLAADANIDPRTLQARVNSAVRALAVGARAGNGRQASTLAWLYRAGELVPKDPATSEFWLSEAARAGDAKAMAKLANQAQADGDLAGARQWLEQAVAAGDQQAAIDLSRGYLTGKFEPASAAAAEDLIARTVAAAASPALQLAYGQALLTGRVVGRDPERGQAMLEGAAAAGYVPAQSELGWRYMRGLDLPYDASHGYALLDAAATEGDTTALFYLGRAHLNGYGVVKNPQRGVELLQQAAGAGSKGAKLELGLRYLRGLDVPPDVAQGEAILETLAAAGHAGAMLQLGTAYTKGHGVARNPQQARDWLMRAAEAGNAEAMSLLQAERSRAARG